MNEELRLAWSEIVTGDDYEQHMAAIGQAQAAASLTQDLFQAAALGEGASVAIVGAGTGQMFDFLDPALFLSLDIVCTDLNPKFLDHLQQRLSALNIKATLLVDDIEQTALKPGWDLLLATLVLEHIDWHRGVEIFAGLRPASCGIIIQENPEGMASAFTPGRSIPPSLAKAAETAHPVLIPRTELIAALEARGYECRGISVREVADGKRLVGILFVARTSR